ERWPDERYKFDNGDFSLALFGSPRWNVVRQQMERLLARPDYPVTCPFADTLDELECWHAGRGRGCRESDAARRVFEGLSLKRGRAAIVTTATALWLSHDPKAHGRLVLALFRGFDTLPPMLQSSLLREPWWQDVKGPGALPVVKRHAE